MARNDITVFDEFKGEVGNKIHDLHDDTIKMAVLDNTTTPAAGDTTPRLADYTEVGTGGNYTAGGIDLACDYTEAGGTATLAATVAPSYALDAGNDTDAFWGLIYNDTSVGKEAIAFIDLGGPVDMSVDALLVTIGDIFDLA